MRNNQTVGKRHYLLVYTALFAVFSACAFFLFALYGKSFVWDQDGGTQYIPYLAYMGQYLRDFVRRALQGDFTVKMYDFTIGYGDDVGSIVRAHPLDFLSVFVPQRYTEQLYTFLILLRIYLAGLSFSGFCFYIGSREKKMAALWTDILTGAFIYAFCGYVLRFGIVHPTFLSAYCILPLVLLAAERMMRGEGFLLLAFSVFLGFMSNYYFMYMTAIALVIYVLIRFPAIFRENRVKHFILLFFRMSGVFLLGTAMAMATLLPIIYMLGSSARLASEADSVNLLSYGGARWRSILVNLIAPRVDPGQASHLSYAVPVFPAAVLLLTEKRGKKAGLKTALVLGYLMLLFPAAAYVMTGFSTTNNRWMFIFAFIISLTYVAEAERLRSLGSKGRVLLAGVWVLYAVLACFECGGRPDAYRAYAMGILAVCVILTGSLSRLAEKDRYRKLRGLYGSGVMLLLVLVSVTANGVFLYGSGFGNFTGEFLDRGTSLSTILDSRFAWINRIEDDSFYRTDSSLVASNTENYSVLLGYHPTSQYNSIISGPLTYWLTETESIGIGAIHRLQSLDGRAAMEALANVKYFFTTADSTGQVPYGFERVEAYSNETYAVYQNRHPLAFGYTYDTCLTREVYLQLDPADRETAMLYAAVAENVPDGLSAMSVSDLPSAEIVEAELPASGEKAEQVEGGYKVKAGGRITIPFEQRAGYVCYLELTGLNTGRAYAYIDLQTADLEKELLIRGMGQPYSLNRTDYLVNLGYAAETKEDAVTISFRRKGTYDLEKIAFRYLPMSGYEDVIEERNAEYLTDVVFGINTVEGKTSITDTKLMVFSIPYSRGWSLKVDGKEQELLQVNTAWMGTMLTEGEHEIRLSYCSPGAVPGRMAAAAAWLFWAVSAICTVKRKSAKITVVNR